VGAVLALIPSGILGQSFDFGGELGASARIFPEPALFAGQESARVSPSLSFAPDFEIEWADGVWRLEGEGLLRLDAHDGRRTHADVRELGVSYLGDRVTAFVGAGQVFWGVAEVRHLVDIVNQIDGVEDLDGEDKLGQPMVALTVDTDWAVLDAYLLPYFRERTFAGHDARLRGPLPVSEAAVFTSDQGRWSPDFALRAFRTDGALDVGLSLFRGTSREPRFALGSNDAGSSALVPEYDRITQVGVDAQWTGERTLLKLEAITREGHAERVDALTLGIEHTLYQIGGSAGDLGVLAEVMLDSRDEGAPATLFDHDLFLGGRWALNDVSDTSLLGGPMVDLSTGEMLLLIEAGRRVGSVWIVGADARLFLRADEGSPMYGVRRDGFVSLSLTRYF
jgi:hypothetical protein